MPATTTDDPYATAAEPDVPAPARPHAGGLRPRVTLLYHPDLARVGETFEGWCDDPSPVTFGRQTPCFVGPDRAQPLDDRFISRAQLVARWNGVRGSFEVAPCPEARLPLSVLSLDDGSARAVTGTVTLAPRSAVAIGRRAVLWFDALPREAVEADSLGLVGHSAAMATLRARVETVARFRESALLLGETGVGKELVARALHARSGATGAVVALNMGALDEGTAASELFGHVRGAFTGAHQSRVGAFEAARDGTLFLDEIGDVAPEIQKKLLRVLEDRRFSPVGGHQAHPLTCRVVAATHSALRAEVDAGQFRRDLFERLQALTVAVPPLRARREDVPGLFAHFLDDLSARHAELGPWWRGVNAEGVAKVPFDFVVALMRHAWPGNVRELRNVATSTAAATLANRVFTPGEMAAPLPTPKSDERVVIPSQEALEAALEAAQGNVRVTAERLGCSRNQLYRWMEARGVDPARHRPAEGPGRR
ncbi:MAG: sigma 54-interacting transcriptional regulator [Polyangiales bacterium]